MELHDKPWGLDLMKLDKALCQRLSTFEDSVTKTLEGLTERLGSLERPQRGEGVTEERMPSGGIRLIVPDPPEDDSGAFLVVARVPSSLMPVCPVCAMTAIQPYDGVLVCGSCNRRLVPLGPEASAEEAEIDLAALRIHLAEEARLIDERRCAEEVERQGKHLRPTPVFPVRSIESACKVLLILAFWLTEEAMRRGKPGQVVAFGRLWLALLWVRDMTMDQQADIKRTWLGEPTPEERPERDAYEAAILTGNLGEILTHLYG